MARLLLFLIALVIIAAIVLTMTGMVNLRQTQNAQAPKFEMDVKEVGIGTTTKNVTVPTVGTETRQVEVPTLTVGDGAEPANQANSQ
jgi:hypothetical protein